MWRSGFKVVRFWNSLSSATEGLAESSRVKFSDEIFLEP